MFLLACRSFAQDALAAEFAKEVQADVTTLSSHPAVAAWQAAHPQEKLQLARYNYEKESYKVDYARVNRWCAASIANSPSVIKRTAFSYVPKVAVGALPPLPGTANASIIKTGCQMQAFWYSAQAPASVTSLVGALSSSWGKPNGTSAKPDIDAWGLWTSVAAWHRGGISIWVALDRGNQAGGSASPGLVVYARRDMSRDDALDQCSERPMPRTGSP